MLSTSAKFFDNLMRRYTPDPFIFAVLLTFLVLFLGYGVEGHSLENMFLYWGESFWSLLSFTLQMGMILLTGFVVATSPVIKNLLRRFAKNIKTEKKAIVVTSFLSAVACLLNWGFGLVVGAFLCRSIAEVHRTYNYRILVASAYSGFLVWHAGFSGSIPLLLATPNNFSQPLIGRIIPLSETLGLPLNIIAVIGLLFLLPLTNLFISKKQKSAYSIQHFEANLDTEEEIDNASIKTPAEKLENSTWMKYCVFFLGALFIFFSISNKTFRIDLNTINLLFLIMGIALHKNLRHFLHATHQGAKKVAPILIQYPFYAGIMGMMQQSGLAATLSKMFVTISTVKTFPFFTFISAGILNFFIPSGGGQWAVQSPIVLSAATQLGADIPKSVMAVAWGDAWTNMAQPFWALPLLAIAGLKIRDIMGFCISILIVSGLWLSFMFLVF